MERKSLTKKVIALGAGMSGLIAAYELVQAGHDVAVLEARMRRGGRVQTWFDRFADGLYTEAGMAAIVPVEPDPLFISHDHKEEMILDPVIERAFSAEESRKLLSEMQSFEV
jgi:monoamine oxidase